jgi:regulatory protein
MPDDTQKEQRLKKAQQIVTQLLKFRLRSEQELRDKLNQKKLPTLVVEQTIQHFKGIELIDDNVFARQWTSSRLKKPFGLNRIRLELKAKGINNEIINDALNDAAHRFNELEVVTQLTRHRIQKYHDIAPEKIKHRLYGYLLRRGFNPNTIIKVINGL